MNKAFSPFLFLFSFLCVSAQVTDSLKAVVNKPTRLTLKFDTRNSFITHTRADILGVKAGVQFVRKMKVGAGYSWLRTRHEKNIFIGADPVPARLRFNYSVLYLEYIFYSTQHWEFSVPLQFGIGNSSYIYSYKSTSFVQGKHIIMLYEPAVSWQYKIVRWFGVGGDIGYRLMLVKNKAIPENFNSPVYSFKAMIYYDELYEMIFKKLIVGH